MSDVQIYDDSDDRYCEEWDSVCTTCGGEGYIVDDCDEDSCCCLNPELDHALIRCPDCNPLIL
jgi:hypothetical protein